MSDLYCCSARSRGVIQALVKLVADVNTITDSYTTPLHIAARNGHVDAIRALFELGGSVYGRWRRRKRRRGRGAR